MFHAISTENAPQPIGAYSQAVRCGNMVFLSGQIPLTPQGELIPEASLADKIRLIFQNISSVASAAGGDLTHVVKLTVYLQDMNFFNAVNDVMAEFFQEPYPARAAVEVSRLPKDVPVEVDAIMMLAD